MVKLIGKLLQTLIKNRGWMPPLNLAIWSFGCGFNLARGRPISEWWIWIVWTAITFSGCLMVIYDPERGKYFDDLKGK
jgi:hypothetical protein